MNTSAIKIKRHIKDVTVAVIGLGYVGLPLAVTLGKKMNTIGFDLNESKITQLLNQVDVTGEVTQEEFEEAHHLTLTGNPTAIKEADFIIVAVPTPIDSARQPDLSPLMSASRIVGLHMKKGAVIIFESTVYPGATEEVCVPILEDESGFRWKKDFHVGYSPERINPGDKEHTLTKIKKVVSGDDAETLDAVAALYESIVTAGVHRTGSIKEAEAAKVIENVQRDINIALINELSIIFDKLNIDTVNVLEAAGSKWNFLRFSPGLVGGHCIGVDPYYLTHKAELVGYHPEIILAGRRINDNMGKFIAEKTVKMMIAAGSHIKESRVGVLGLTFKENCPDLRNSRVPDIVAELATYGIEVLVHDPMADADEAKAFYGVDLVSFDEMEGLDALVVAVSHSFYGEQGVDKVAGKVVPGGCLIDVKSMFDPVDVASYDLSFWRL
jgi:UDP-N-acetyl-D-glucosamine/UDP-N-acetyl-D-galactosamine dehydrogenase